MRFDGFEYDICGTFGSRCNRTPRWNVDPRRHLAREYGLPCVTDIPDATTLIHTGDDNTVDGFLGIVAISQKDR